MLTNKISWLLFCTPFYIILFILYENSLKMSRIPQLTCWGGAPVVMEWENNTFPISTNFRMNACNKRQHKHIVQRSAEATTNKEHILHVIPQTLMFL